MMGVAYGLGVDCGHIKSFWVSFLLHIEEKFTLKACKANMPQVYWGDTESYPLPHPKRTMQSTRLYVQGVLYS